MSHVSLISCEAPGKASRDGARAGENGSVLDLSAVMPTRNRPRLLERTLHSIAAQGVVFNELVVVDSSTDEATRDICARWAADGRLPAPIRYLRAEVAGAAAQRNQGFAASTSPYVLFVDDDVEFEPNCLQRLYRAVADDPGVGGASTLIANDHYHPPGLATRTVLRLIGAGPGPWAGRVVGPAINFWPDDGDHLPEVVPVEWMNSGCVLYRRAALPCPPFDSVFTGYSMMEDLTLSLRVGRSWRLVNARTARIRHEDNPGEHKSDPAAMAEMALLNRHYVMTEVLGHRRPRHYLQLAVWWAFTHLALLRQSPTRRTLFQRLRGEWRALRRIAA
jgi:glycosyltransferase involved in cell wall biosynthesis